MTVDSRIVELSRTAFIPAFLEFEFPLRPSMNLKKAAFSRSRPLCLVRTSQCGELSEKTTWIDWEFCSNNEKMRSCTDFHCCSANSQSAKCSRRYRMCVVSRLPLQASCKRKVIMFLGLHKRSIQRALGVLSLAAAMLAISASSPTALQATQEEAGKQC